MGVVKCGSWLGSLPSSSLVCYSYTVGLELPVQ